MGTVGKFSSHSLDSASTTTESREYGDNLTNLYKKAAELGLLLIRYTPDRMKLVVHLNEIADEMEETHQSVVKRKAFGNIVGIGGAGLAIVGTVALAPFYVGVGAVAGLVGLAVKLTSSSKEEMHGKWKEVKTAIERDTEAWGYVKKTVEEIQQLVQQNEKLTEEKKWAIPAGLVLEFEAAKGQVEKVILQLNVLRLNVPDEQKLDALMQAIACTMSAIMAAGGETIMKGTEVGHANAEDVNQTGADRETAVESVEQVTTAGTGAKEYTLNACKTTPLSTAAKISVALNVVSMMVDVYEFAQNYKQFDSPRENAKILRALATQLEELFKQ